MLKLKIFNTQKKKDQNGGKTFSYMTLWHAVLGGTQTLKHLTCCSTLLLACLPVMRLWQPQRVVYVMAAETFHRRACCQIVCESKTKETKESEKEVEWGKEQASKTVLNFCQGHCERAAQKSISLFFIFNRNSKPRHSHKNVHTLVEILAVARPRPSRPTHALVLTCTPCHISCQEAKPQNAAISSSVVVAGGKHHHYQAAKLSN